MERDDNFAGQTEKVHLGDKSWIKHPIWDSIQK